MQTFLPYEEFHTSAMALDKRRCWKQVVEARQIVDVLEGKKVSWANHPAVKMWIGHELAMRQYFNEFLEVCKEKHDINTKYEKLYIGIPRYLIDYPWWLGDKNFHRAMRSRLIKKDRDFYLPLFPEDEGFNDGRYFWPVMETKTFRMI
jgi:hypothetical protein